MKILSFRTLQAFEDLTAAVANYAPDLTLDDQGIQQAWVNATGDEDELQQSENTFNRRLGALAFIFAHALKYENDDPVLEWIWEHNRAYILTAPPSLRTALGHGAVVLQTFLGQMSDASLLNQDALLTKPQAVVENGLIKLAKSSPVELPAFFVSNGMYRTQKYREDKISALLSSEELKYSQNLSWVREAVLERAIDASNESIRLPATALCLLWAIRDQNRRHEIDTLFARHFMEGAGNPFQKVDPVLDGFRFFYENTDNWDPTLFFDWHGGVKRYRIIDWRASP